MWTAMSTNVPLDVFTQQRFILACAFVVWTESSLGTFWIAKGATFLHADNENLIRLHRYAGWFESLLGVHARRYVFLCCGSYVIVSSHSSLAFFHYHHSPQQRLIFIEWSWQTDVSESNVIGTCTRQTLALVLLNPDMSCLCKQCRSRSVGFWRSQLIWICTVCH